MPRVIIMNQTRTFQLFVVIAAVCYIAWFFFYYWANPSSDIESRFLAVSGHGAVLPIRHPVYYGTWFGIWLITSFGILFFQNWARHMYLVLTVLGQLLIPFSGFVATLPLDYLFGSTVLLLDGVILGMAYFSPLAANFQR